MRKFMKKSLATMLCVCMVTAVVPGLVYAEDTVETEEVSTEQGEQVAEPDTQKVQDESESISSGTTMSGDAVSGDVELGNTMPEDTTTELVTSENVEAESTSQTDPVDDSSEQEVTKSQETPFVDDTTEKNLETARVALAKEAKQSKAAPVATPSLSLVGKDGVVINISDSVTGIGYSYDKDKNQLTLDNYTGKSIDSTITGLLIYFIGDNLLESDDVAIKGKGDITLASDGKGKVTITSKHDMSEDQMEELMEDAFDDMSDVLEKIDFEDADLENMSEKELEAFAKKQLEMVVDEVQEVILDKGSQLLGSAISTTGKVTIKDGTYEINSEGTYASTGIMSDSLAIENASVDVNAKAVGSDMVAIGILSNQTKVTDSTLNVNATTTFRNKEDEEDSSGSLTFGIGCDQMDILRSTVNVKSEAVGEDSIAIGVMALNGEPTVTEGSLNIETKGAYTKDKIYSTEDLMQFIEDAGLIEGTGGSPSPDGEDSGEIISTKSAAIAAATGDETNVGGWMLMVLCGLCMMFGATIVKKRL